MPREKFPELPELSIIPVLRTIEAVASLPGEKGASAGILLIELKRIISSSPFFIPR